MKRLRYRALHVALTREQIQAANAYHTGLGLVWLVCVGQRNRPKNVKEPLILRSLGCIFTNEEEQEPVCARRNSHRGWRARGGNALRRQNKCGASRGRRSVMPKLSRRVWRDELHRCLLHYYFY